MADDKTPILYPSRPSSSLPTEDAVFHDSGQGPRAKLLQMFFVVVVVLMVLICLILSIYQGVTLSDNGGLFFMLGLSLIGFVFMEIVLIWFIRRGELPKEKTWFLYFLGFCIGLECVFTDVILFEP